MDLCRGDDLVEKLHDLSSRLEAIRAGLFGLFSRKRKAFPMFYFLNDDELLSFLVKAKLGLTQVESMLHKLLPGVESLSFKRMLDRGEKATEEVVILGLKSSDGDYLNIFEELRLQVRIFFALQSPHSLSVVLRLFCSGVPGISCFIFLFTSRFSLNVLLLECRNQFMTVFSIIDWCRSRGLDRKPAVQHEAVCQGIHRICPWGGRNSRFQHLECLTSFASNAYCNQDPVVPRRNKSTESELPSTFFEKSPCTR